MARARPSKKAKSSKKISRKPARTAKRRATSAPRRASRPDALFAPMKGAVRKDLGHVQLEFARAGAARVKRIIYPAGFRWSVDMKPVAHTNLCMHAHVGFLASGAIRVEYPDGCVEEFTAPQVVAVGPGHDGAVVGEVPAVLIEFDFEKDTVARLGRPLAHTHG